jgi:hypothetical protein
MYAAWWMTCTDAQKKKMVTSRVRLMMASETTMTVGVAPVALPEVRLHEGHGVGGEQVRPADKGGDDEVHDDVREAAELGEEVRHDEQHAGEDDEGQVVEGRDQPHVLGGDPRRCGRDGQGSQGDYRPREGIELFSLVPFTSHPSSFYKRRSRLCKDSV